MAIIRDLKLERRKRNRMTARETLTEIDNAIATAKRALKALGEKRGLCLKILKGEKNDPS